MMPASNKTTIFIKSIFLFTAVLFSQSLPAAQTLPEFHAKYAVQKYGTKLAEAKYDLSHTDSGYKFTQNTELYGWARLFADDKISATSLIETSGNKLLLTRHRFLQTGSDEDENADISIQWNKSGNELTGKITGTVQGKKINLGTGTEIWDILSFQVPLMIEANKDKKEYPYKALLDGEIDTYNFVLASNDSVSFAGKQYRALQMVRTDPDKDRQLQIWLIPALHNIPVIVENYRDGELHSRLQLESLQFGNGNPLTEIDPDDF